MKNIKVSVIMSAYNEEEKWIREAIESILNQTFTDFELILILDNPDNIILDKIITEYENQDDRIVYIKNEKNLGLVESLNKGLSIASGKYIARMDADDISSVNRLKIQYDYMEKNTEISLIGSSVDFIDEKNTTIRYNTSVVKNTDKMKTYLKFTNVIVHPTFFFRKSILKDVHGYREVQFAEDYDFICRLVAGGYKVTNLDEVLLKYRIRKNSISRDKTLAQIYNSFYLKKLYRNRLKNGVDDYKFSDLYSNDKLSKKEINDFNKSESLKLRSEIEKKLGNNIKGKLLFLYSKLISKYARENAISTLKYKILARIYE